jgi:pyruvate,water dikinase
MLLQALGSRHPRLLIEQGKEDEFVDEMTKALVAIARPFGARPVTYRFHDFRTNEFRKLEGGERFEPVEANPMIGFRGCARYLADPALLKLEIRAVLRARNDEGCENLQVMLPFVRTRREIRACAALLREAGLDPQKVPLHAMAEVPSIKSHLEELCDQGFSGISIGTNDLTQLLLGVDRDNETLADTFDARDPAVLEYLADLIPRARALGLHTAICGQAPSIHPGYAEHLVGFGIDAISVNPDTVPATRRRVFAAERRLLLDAARRGPRTS